MSSIMIMIIVIIILTIMSYIACYMIKDYLIFKPYPASSGTIIHKCQEQNTSTSDFKISSTDNTLLHCIYIKNHMSPNTLFLYAHGNSGNILYRTNSKLVKYLLKFGSILLFDYRGYGFSTGTPSAQGVKDDMLYVWNYVVDQMKFDPQQIILYGESLGCSMVSWLISYLFETQVKVPKACILQAGFYSLKEIVANLSFRLMSYLIPNDFNNIQYVHNIKQHNQDYPIYSLHSPNDTLINIYHAELMSKETGSILIPIQGSHNDPIFNAESTEMLDNLVRMKISI